MKIIKIVLVAILAVYIAFIWNMNGVSDRSAEAIASDVVSKQDTVEMVKGNDKTLLQFYGLAAIDYDGYVVWSSKKKIDVDELLIIKAKNKDQINTLRDAVDQRVKAQEEAFDGYGTAQMALLRKNIVTTRGNYLFFAVSKKAGDWNSLFVKAVKK